MACKQQQLTAEVWLSSGSSRWALLKAGKQDMVLQFTHGGHCHSATSKGGCNTLTGCSSHGIHLKKAVPSSHRNQCRYTNKSLQGTCGNPSLRLQVMLELSVGVWWQQWAHLWEVCPGSSTAQPGDRASGGGGQRLRRIMKSEKIDWWNHTLPSLGCIRQPPHKKWRIPCPLTSKTKEKPYKSENRSRFLLVLVCKMSPSPTHSLSCPHTTGMRLWNLMDRQKMMWTKAHPGWQSHLGLHCPPYHDYLHQEKKKSCCHMWLPSEEKRGLYQIQHKKRSLLPFWGPHKRLKISQALCSPLIIIQDCFFMLATMK